MKLSGRARTLAGLLVAACLFPATAGAAEDWLLIEFTRNLPPCENAKPGDRCWGTEAEIASFEVRSGETLSRPDSGLLPPAWIELRQLWLPVSELGTATDFSITVDRTPRGARLQIYDGGTSYLQSMHLNEWTRLEPAGGQRSGLVWARVIADPDS